jgi:hypothetical protein
MPTKQKIGTVKKTDTTEIRVSISEYKDKEYIDVREYYTNDDGDMRPSRSGITIKKSAQAEEIGTLLIKAAEEFKE